MRAASRREETLACKPSPRGMDSSGVRDHVPESALYVANVRRKHQYCVCESLCVVKALQLSSRGSCANNVSNSRVDTLWKSSAVGSDHSKCTTF